MGVTCMIGAMPGAIPGVAPYIGIGIPGYMEARETVGICRARASCTNFS